MAWPTFATEAELDDPLWSMYRETPQTANVLGPYKDHMANLAIFNKVGSNKVVRILRATCSPAAAGDATTVPQTLRWQRCSAAVLGKEMLTPIKLDSNNAALPSQVKVYGYPSSVTLTANAVLIERLMIYPTPSATALFSFSDVSRPLATNYEWNTSDQKIVLREGEGICLHTGGNVYGTSAFEATIRFRNASTGATYQVRYSFKPDTYACIALMNESGSGVVLEVSKLVVQAQAAGDIPYFSCEIIDGIEEETGIAAEVKGMDSLTPLDSNVIVRRRTHVQGGGSKTGAWVPYVEFAPRGCACPATGPACVQGIGNGLAGMETTNLGVPFRRARTPKYEVVIREGQGFAWFLRAPSGIGAYDVGFVFTVEPAYPAAGDVRSGTVYGPNNEEYTGTLPAGGRTANPVYQLGVV